MKNQKPKPSDKKAESKKLDDKTDVTGDEQETTTGGEKNKAEKGEENINFNQTNEAGAIKPLTDDDRLVTPGNNVIIEGDPELLKEKIPERTTAMKKVDITGAAPTPDTPEPVTTQPQPQTQTFQQPPTSGPAPQPKDNFDTGFNATAQPAPAPQPKSKGGKEEDTHLQTADFLHRNALQGGLHLLGKNIGISMKKVNTLHSAGKLNKNTAIPIQLQSGELGHISMEGRIIMHNNQISGEFDSIVSEEWIQENNSLLAQILRKKGAAMTPEQQYGFNIGAIAISAGFAAFSSIKANNELLKEFQRISTPVAVQPSAPPPPPPAAQTTAPDGPPPPPVDSEALRKANNKVEDVVNKALGNTVKKKRIRIARVKVDKPALTTTENPAQTVS